MRFPSRPVLVAAAVLVQGALAAWAVQPQLSARFTGTEYRLAVEPADEFGPLYQGSYAWLGYPGLPYGLLGEGRVHIPLVRDGSLWKGADPVKDRPRSPYLICKSYGCGLTRVYVPSERAEAVERDIDAGRLVAVLRISDRGHATFVRFEPR